MNIYIRKADLSVEIKKVMRYDHLIFSTDAYETAERWEDLKCYWLEIDGKAVGTAAFAHDIDVDEQGEDVKTPGNVFVESTGILPEFQGRGLGTVLKAFEIAYAIGHGFKRISATCRKGNETIISLNGLFGLEPVSEIPGYYSNPNEAGIRIAKTFP